MSKHTPGPWEISEGELGNVWEASIFKPDSGTICRLDDEMIGCKANAKLIAAAPELLQAASAALMFVINVQRRHPDFAPGKIGETTEKMLREAIAKATEE